MILPAVFATARATKIAGIAVGSVTIVCLAFYLLSDPESVLHRSWRSYHAYLRRRMEGLFLRGKPESIAYAQGVLVLFVITAATVLHDIRFLLLTAVVMVLPWAWLEIKHSRRVVAIELQTDGFVTALGNALKATPSVADAFISLRAVMSAPIKDEIELAVKQMRLGCTLEEALEMMGKRVGSRMLDTALASVLIGQRVGGNLPRILETSGAALRELQRLESFVRAKTASGRIQMIVVSLAPIAFVIFFDRTQPHYFDPLTASRTGMLILGGAVVAWIVAVILGRKILRVDV